MLHAPHPTSLKSGLPQRRVPMFLTGLLPQETVFRTDLHRHRPAHRLCSNSANVLPPGATRLFPLAFDQQPLCPTPRIPIRVGDARNLARRCHTWGAISHHTLPIYRPRHHPRLLCRTSSRWTLHPAPHRLPLAADVLVPKDPVPPDIVVATSAILFSPPSDTPVPDAVVIPKEPGPPNILQFPPVEERTSAPLAPIPVPKPPNIPVVTLPQLKDPSASAQWRLAKKGKG